MSQLLPLAIAFLGSLLLSYLSSPLAKAVAVRFRLVDRPASRRETVLKPRLGGLAMYLAFTVAILVTVLVAPERPSAELLKVAGLLLGATTVLIMGIVDDRYELGPLSQLLVQLAAATIAVLSGIRITQVPNPFGEPTVNSMFQFPEVLAVAFTLFWIVGAMNAINFIDGLDGLAAGIAAIAAITLFVHSFGLSQYSIALLPLALAGSALGFLPHNFSPAKITMGTSGAVFLGYTLSTISVIGGTKAATLLLVLGIPIIDAAWIIGRRLITRRSPFQADRAHIHHRLMEMGLSQRQIVLLLYSLCAAFGTLAIVLSTRLMKLYAIAGMVVLVGAVLAIIAQKKFGRIS
ncbi:MAG: undecaprenyl/decaprenyl-phosphate alpha-N-acetylglucosaminyl 1-phosphate transferase [Chloroflexi bacterium]|nr:undecaprenyl/decaprenyl-phosphate alpha-N-acetylglucosaminyl 1-phosphate transferase [Chloroflexota bacterium]